MHAKARHTYIKYLTFYIELCDNIVNILQLYKAVMICYMVYIALCKYSWIYFYIKKYI